MSEGQVLTELWGHECPPGSFLVIEQLEDPETGVKSLYLTCAEGTPVVEPQTVDGWITLSIAGHEEQYRFEGTFTPGETTLTDVLIVEELE